VIGKVIVGVRVIDRPQPSKLLDVCCYLGVRVSACMCLLSSAYPFCLPHLPLSAADTTHTIQSTALSVKRRPGTDSGASDVDDSIYECCLKNQLHRTSTCFSLQIQEASDSFIINKSQNKNKERQVGRKSQLQDGSAAAAGAGSTAVCRYEPMSNTQVLPEYLHKAIDCEPSMVCLICPTDSVGCECFVPECVA